MQLTTSSATSRTHERVRRTPYDADFYRWHHDSAKYAAERILPIVLEAVRPRTVVDVGCGDGTWSAVLLERGLDVVAVDGAHVDQGVLAIPPQTFRPVDLRQGFSHLGSFDLAISLEVAEHLPEASAGPFVADLTRLAPVVVFSAAVPMQGGHEHLNEKWQSYWATVFAKHGFAAFDLVRPEVWYDARIPTWYRQNVLLYANEDAQQRIGLLPTMNPQLLDVIHPGMFQAKQTKPTLSHLLRTLPAALRQTDVTELGGGLSACMRRMRNR